MGGGSRQNRSTKDRSEHATIYKGRQRSEAREMMKFIDIWHMHTRTRAAQKRVKDWGTFE